MAKKIKDNNAECPSHNMRLIEENENGKLYRCEYCGKTSLTDMNDVLGRLILFFTIGIMVIIFTVSFLL